jgi:tRNA nucleotidyltransferase (CCA-adding enzyme)
VQIMRIQDVMSKPVVTVAPDTDIATARERLSGGGIDHLVVVDGKRVVGVVAGRDILRIADDQPVAAFMSREVVTIEPEATLRRAAGIMRGRGVGSLLVVDGSRLTGIVTTSDLLTALAKGDTHAAPSPERVILRKRGPRKRHIAI